MTQAYGPCVRLRREASVTGGDDLIVELRHQLGKANAAGPIWPFPTYQWVEKGRFNEMSNGRAFTEADTLARDLRKKVFEGEA